MRAYIEERRRLQAGQGDQDSPLARGRATEARHQAAEAKAWATRRTARAKGD